MKYLKFFPFIFLLFFDHIRRRHFYDCLPSFCRSNWLEFDSCEHTWTLSLFFESKLFCSGRDIQQFFDMMSPSFLFFIGNISLCLHMQQGYQNAVSYPKVPKFPATNAKFHLKSNKNENHQFLTYRSIFWH